MATSDLAEVIKVWDFYSGGQIANISGLGPLAFSEDGAYLEGFQYYQDKKEKEKKVKYVFWSTKTWEKEKEIQWERLVDWYNGLRLNIKIGANEVKLLRPGTDIAMQEINTPEFQTLLARVGPGKELLATADDDNRVRIWNLGDGRGSFMIKPEKYYFNDVSFRCPFETDKFDLLLFSPQGNHLVFGDSSLVFIADIEKGEVVRQLEFRDRKSKFLAMGATLEPQPGAERIFRFKNGTTDEILKDVDLDFATNRRQDLIFQERRDNPNVRTGIRRYENWKKRRTLDSIRVEQIRLDSINAQIIWRDSMEGEGITIEIGISRSQYEQGITTLSEVVDTLPPSVPANDSLLDYYQEKDTFYFRTRHYIGENDSSYWTITPVSQYIWLGQSNYFTNLCQCQFGPDPVLEEPPPPAIVEEEEVLEEILPPPPLPQKKGPTCLSSDNITPSKSPRFKPISSRYQSSLAGEDENDSLSDENTQVDTIYCLVQPQDRLDSTRFLPIALNRDDALTALDDSNATSMRTFLCMPNPGGNTLKLQFAPIQFQSQPAIIPQDTLICIVTDTAGEIEYEFAPIHFQRDSLSQTTDSLLSNLDTLICISGLDDSEPVFQFHPIDFGSPYDPDSLAQEEKGEGYLTINCVIPPEWKGGYIFRGIDIQSFTTSSDDLIEETFVDDFGCEYFEILDSLGAIVGDTIYLETALENWSLSSQFQSLNTLKWMIKPESKFLAGLFKNLSLTITKDSLKVQENKDFDPDEFFGTPSMEGWQHPYLSINQDQTYLVFWNRQDQTGKNFQPDALEVYSFKTGLKETEFIPHQAPLTDFGFVPKETQLITSSVDRTAVVWEITNDSPFVNKIREFKSNSLPVNLIMVGRKNGGLLTGSLQTDYSQPLNAREFNGIVNLWDLKRAERTASLSFKRCVASYISFDDTEEYILSNTASRANAHPGLEIFDIKAKNRIGFETEYGVLREILFFPSHNHFMILGGTHKKGIMEGWDLERAKRFVKFTEHDSQITAFYQSNDGLNFITGDEKGEITAWDLIRVKVRKSWKGHSGRVGAITYAPKGYVIFSSGLDGKICKWDWDGNQLVFNGNRTTPYKVMASSEKGDFLLAVDWHNNINLIDGKNLRVLSEYSNISSEITDLELTPNGKLCSVTIKGLQNDSLGIYFNQLLSINMDSFLIREVAYLPPPGNNIFVGHSSSQHPLYKLSPSGKILLKGGNGSPLISYDLKQGVVMDTFPYITAFTTAMTISGDDSILVTATLDNEGSQLRAWNLKTSERILTFGENAPLGRSCGSLKYLQPGKFKKVKNMRLSPLGDRLLLKHWSGDFSILSLQTKHQLTYIKNRTSYLQGIQYRNKKFYHYYRKKALPRLWLTRKLLPKPSKDREQIARDLISSTGLSGSRSMSIHKEFPWISRSSKDARTYRVKISSIGEEANSVTLKFNSFQVLKPNRNADASKGLLAKKNVKGAIDVEHKEGVLSTEKSKDRKFYYSSGLDTRTLMWKKKDLDINLTAIVSADNRDYILLTPDNYYFATPNGTQMVAFKYGNRIIPFSQFDHICNKPDKIVERLPQHDTSWLKILDRSYQKRLEILSLSNPILSEQDFNNLPQLSLGRDSLRYSTTSEKYRVKLQARDTTHFISRIQAYVNNVPVLGLNGAVLADSVKEWNGTINVPLANGINHIEVVAFNNKGIASLTEYLDVKRTGERQARNLFLLTLGASEYYSCNGINPAQLPTPTHDCKKLPGEIKKLNQEYHAFDEVYSITRVNKEFAKDMYGSLAEFLTNSGPNDQIWVYITAHGEIDSTKKELFFYSGSENNSCEKIYFREIDSLIALAKGQDRLVIINSCHSGVFDPTGNTYIPDEEFLVMRRIFPDLSPSSGSFEISSSSAYSYTKDLVTNQDTMSYMAIGFLEQFKTRTSLRVDQFSSDFKGYFRLKGLQDAYKPELRHSNLRNNFILWEPKGGINFISRK